MLKTIVIWGLCIFAGLYISQELVVLSHKKIIDYDKIKYYIHFIYIWLLRFAVISIVLISIIAAYLYL